MSLGPRAESHFRSFWYQDNYADVHAHEWQEQKVWGIRSLLVSRQCRRARTRVCAVLGPASMMDRLSALAARRPEGLGGDASGLKEEFRKRAAHARASKGNKKAGDAPRETVNPEKLQVAVACIPGVKEVLNVATLRRSTPVERVVSMIRTALSPAVRGQGAAVERCRRLQHHGQALLSDFVLASQDAALEQWKGTVNGALVRGVNILWDEASQRLRGIFDVVSASGESSQQKVLHVLVAQTSVFQTHGIMVPSGEGIYRIENQPWLAGPAFLRSVKHGEVLEGLRRCSPVALHDRRSVADIGRGAEMAVLTLSFDAGSSNLLGYRCMIAAVEAADVDKTFCHGERCATHCFHTVKAKCIKNSQLDSVLFSVGKIIQHNRSSAAFCQGFIDQVKANHEVRYYEGAKPQGDKRLEEALEHIIAIDGDTSLREAVRGRSWSSRVRKMVQECPFDGETGRWIIWRPASEQFAVGGVTDDVLKKFAEPLLECFVFGGWQDGALSRWTAVMENLKKVTVGAAFNAALLKNLSSLAANMNLTEATVNRMLEEIKEKRRRGQESDDKWANHCSRVVRVSLSLRDPGKRWQCAVALNTALIVDRLHWDILPDERMEKRMAGLTEMVDPYKSIVCKALHRVVLEMDDYKEEAKVFGILRALGGDMHDPEVSRHTLKQYCQVSAGIFLRGDVRLASPFYQGQLFVSKTLAKEERELALNDIYARADCCLGSFMRKFRKRFKTVAEASHPLAGGAVFSTVDEQLAFTTATVECEHKEMKEEIASKGRGVSRGVAARRIICRRLQRAHLNRGGADVGLPFRRKRTTCKRKGDAELQSQANRPRLLAIAAAGAADDAVVPAAGNPGADIDMSVLMRWGKIPNAKLLYRNYQSHVIATGRQNVTKARHKELLDKEMLQWDAKPHLRQRWARLHQSLRKNKRDHGEATLAAKRKRPAGNQKPYVPVWPATFKDMGPTCTEITVDEGPVEAHILTQWKKEKRFTWKKWKLFAKILAALTSWTRSSRPWYRNALATLGAAAQC